MSTTPAPRSLLTRLVDDAAVFPPGNAPVDRAWSEHLELRRGRYADLLGPLLIGASGAANLVEAAAAAPPPEDLETGTGHGPLPIGVGVIARPGTPVEDLLTAVESITAADHVIVAGVELGHAEAAQAWDCVLDLGVPVAVEVPRAPETMLSVLDEIAARADANDRAIPTIAKLRTQSTPTAAVPSARELAEFLSAVRDRDLAFKLTGGLHHAVAHTVELPEGGSEDQHGVLNVLVATHFLEDGAGLTDLTATLEMRDAEALASLARSLDENGVGAVRARFVSFGCCGVTDPLDDLTDLGVLPR
ncbi:hypothetical protein [Ornithinimicrobium sp. Y1694]|uniref:hypothetical protein n=1 Tax=Ornithinimicrobium sp. Y1694 TaxID=3418590 RepID=UPI003CF1090E